MTDGPQPPEHPAPVDPEGELGNIDGEGGSAPGPSPDNGDK